MTTPNAPLAGTDLPAFRQHVRQGVVDWLPPAVQQAAAALAGASLAQSVRGDREHTMAALQVLQGRQAAFSAQFAAVLREELNGVDGERAPRDAASPRGLTLMAEDDVDESIEVARVVQEIELEAEWPLADLAALTSRLAGSGAISVDTVVLRPALVGRALRRASLAFGLDRPARLKLMSSVGRAVAERLRGVYEEQARWLKERGVEPLGFRVRRTAAAGAAKPAGQSPAAGSPAPAATRPAALAPSAALQRLVQWAREEPGTPAAAAPLRLLDEPAAPREPGDLDAGAAVRVIERLLATLQRQAGDRPAMQQLIQRLDSPARAVAERDPALWRSLDHPLWQLIDRVLAVGVLPEDDATVAADLFAAIDRAVVSVGRQPAADAKGSREAVQQLDFAITGVMDQQAERLAPAAAVLQQQVDREELELGLRDQIVQQLRLTPVPLGLRQFLLGPWVAALVVATQSGGVALQRRADVVDDLIASCAQAGGRAVLPAQREALLARAREGLEAAGLPAPRVSAELQDLARVLEAPGEPQPEPEAPPPAELPVAEVIGMHAGLPTVPIDAIDGHDVGAAQADRTHWLGSLRVGDYLRIFMLGRWMTAQVRWASDNRSMFVLRSRHGGRLHSLTRRALEKLRAAGLVATIEHGRFIAEAMETLTEDSGA